MDFGSFVVPYITGAAKTGGFYHEILTNAKNFIKSMSPFTKISHHMHIDLKNAIFSYISETGALYSIPANFIPKPVDRSIPEPMHMGSSQVSLTVSVNIDVTLRPSKPPRRAPKRPLTVDPTFDLRQNLRPIQTEQPSTSGKNLDIIRPRSRDPRIKFPRFEKKMFEDNN